MTQAPTPATDRTLRVTHGQRSAAFVRTDRGWRPDWFYQGDRPMLRFTDHHWLSLGHERATFADSVEQLDNGGARFTGQAEYGNVPIRFQVTVAPDPHGPGFQVDTRFTPEGSVELLEAFSSFETPYEYDGLEHVTTVIGQNPITRYHGPERQTPPIWRHPAWLYSRVQALHTTAPTHLPILCQSVANPDGSNARYTSVVGDWNICQAKDAYACPTRSTENDPPGTVWNHMAEQRGYKFIVGAHNWASAFSKDPNALYRGGQAHAQRVFVSYDGHCPGGSFDAMLLAAWERAAAIDRPTDGRVPAYDRAAERGVSWTAAADWLRGVLVGEGAEGLFIPERGFTAYAPGTRPKGGGNYGWFFWPQWAGPLRYRALLTGDDQLNQRCDELDERFAASDAADSYDKQSITGFIMLLPTLTWLAGPGRESRLAQFLRQPMLRACERSREENGQKRTMDYGYQAVTAEGFLLGYQAWGEEALLDQAMLLLGECNEKLEGNFWEFNLDRADSLNHGGQIRPFGHGHAALANLLAARVTGEKKLLETARRFARYLVSINYITHNGSQDPDLDFRGWANGSNAGRDQLAEIPPWETINSLLAMACLLDEGDLEPGCLDALWYISRTGLGAYPAARTKKLIYEPDLQRRILVDRQSIASEKRIYDTLPYLAYENPLDQTMLASYQGTDALLGELQFGGGLATADDDRLGVFVPRVFLMDEAELRERRVVVWNPTDKPIDATITARWSDGVRRQEAVSVGPRQMKRLAIAKG